MGGYASGDLVGASDLKDRSLWKACIAEVLGTMVLVFVGCGSCIMHTGFPAEHGGALTGVVGLSLGFGVAVASMAQAIGHVSGCHINPAVSVGLVAGGKMGLIKMGIYIGCQCFGAALGAFILRFVGPPRGDDDIKIGKLNTYRQEWEKLCWTAPNEFLGVDIDEKTKQAIQVSFVGQMKALVIEFLITMILVLTVFGATDELNDVKGSAPLAIGLSITVCHLFAATRTGSSMNPARSFGSAVGTLFNDHYEDKDKHIKIDNRYPWRYMWIYWLGPIGGGAVAGLLYRFVFRAQGPDNRTAPMPAQYAYAQATPSQGKPSESMEEVSQA